MCIHHIQSKWKKCVYITCSQNLKINITKVSIILWGKLLHKEYIFNTNRCQVHIFWHTTKIFPDLILFVNRHQSLQQHSFSSFTSSSNPLRTTRPPCQLHLSSNRNRSCIDRPTRLQLNIHNKFHLCKVCVCAYYFIFF